MVQNSAQIRRQGPHDFLAYYEFLCAKQDSVPVNAVKINLDKGMLDFNGDKLKLVDWPPILGSISINKHLRHIAISSTFQGDISYGKYGSRRKIPPICSKDMTFKLCKALRECLTVSPCLKTLHLHGLPLRERDLITLTKGLAESSSVENVSLANCPISDNGLEIICQSVKYSTSIRSVDFTGCNLTWIGAEHMANIIKHQAMQRHSAAWAESLRYRLPQFDVMSGLRRITLNGNSLIGDRGAAALAHELTEDLWVKAVDLQKCGLSNEGARRLLEALKTNSSLCVLDIRNNPLVGKTVHNYKSCKNLHIHRPLKFSSVLTLFSIMFWFKNASQSLKCRIFLHYQFFSKIQTSFISSQCELEKGYLRDANRSLSEALGAPGSGSALRTFSSLEDESVLESIENSFNKFHAFLDLLKDAGLGQLASMAGINTSDFQPLGKPQLSSTVGPQQEAAASTTPPSLHKDRLVDVTFNHTGLDAAAPALPGEEEPHQYFRPATQPDSGSEHSQKSFEHFPFGKTFQSRPSRQEMEASSNRSSSYHGNSISNNSMYSGESQINSTHGGFPESVSEIMSDKGESLGSVGSVSSGNRRLMFGQPGSERSEGSERGAYSLNQIGSLGGQSVDKFL
uniref:Centrosomal protein 78 n=1 Tax=Poecilia latipinna TaxID=48699 RepID=A0A3B3V3X9_9TELE